MREYRIRSTVAVYWIVTHLYLFVRQTNAFVGRADIIGVWKLSYTDSFFPISQKDENFQGKMNEVLLRLDEDGSFVQYGVDQATLEDKKSKSMSHWLDQAQALGSDGALPPPSRESEKQKLLRGAWDLRDQCLLLAADRPEGSDAAKVHDTLLVGTIEAPAMPSPQQQPSSLSKSKRSDRTQQTMDHCLSVTDGKISIGKFMYPRRHPSFFESPVLVRATRSGRFCLHQVIGKLHTQQATKKEKVVRYRKQNFYGRTFLLAISPLPERKQQKLIWSREAGKYRLENDDKVSEEQLFDLRVMPINFFANNTFCAIGTNKVLRGRFHTTGEEKEQLLFTVSLFGSGRSVKGSIYSEGKGLTHDDKRTYLGAIQELPDPKSTNRPKLYLEGSVVIGTDLGTDARPEPVGIFVLRETTSGAASADDNEGENHESIFD